MNVFFSYIFFGNSGFTDFIYYTYICITNKICKTDVDTFFFCNDGLRCCLYSEFKKTFFF